MALIDAGAERLKKLEAAAGEADKRYGAAADEALGRAPQAADKLDKAVMAELAPLKLERADSSTEVETEPTTAGRRASTASSSGCRPIPARGPVR